ncbi:MAG: DNA-directed DNA polymerase II large subunit [Halobacteriales archaeon]|nr:DNA-directed DNA polymerase II large subunit [Halobacteriales archaeon]
MREADQRYFDRIERQVEDAFEVARAAKAQGKDPETEVEIPVAKDMADRVENILGIDGVADRVRELDARMSREEAALELARDFAEDRVGDYETREGKIEGAVRTAVALLTEGVVAAPIEGIDRVELLENDDGTEFVRVFYAGPIRSAGGTAQALSVLVADYARSILGIDRYKPREDEIERYAEEIELYDEETGLQYTPKPAETKFIARHCPIMLDGESTGAEEVSGYRDLERVDTNSPRGGMCLVLAEGIALKVPKIQRYTNQLEEVEWPWLEDLKQNKVTDGGTTTEAGTDTDVEGDPDADADLATAEAEADVDAGAEAVESAPASDPDEPPDSPAGPGDDPERDTPPRVDPDKKFLRDLIAGRPVFSHPSADGGFRLRYGRARNHGFATAGVHPATMHLVDDFLATGTQIKTERPGKAAGVVPVDSIEGPTVKLATGEVRRIDDPEEAKEIRNGVVDILDLGEYLVNYGEFVENNHPLAPASYVREWWEQDVAAAGGDLQALRDDPSVDLAAPSAEQAIQWAREFDVPLHPAYTYLWHDIDVAAFEALADAVVDGRIEETMDGRVLQLPSTDELAETLEALLIEHTQGDATITIPEPLALLRSLGITPALDRTWTDLPDGAREWPNAMRAVNAVAPFEVRERAPTRIGNRMGRPEKSEVRELSPAVHTLFPIGEGGGNQRDVTAAATHAEGMQDDPGQITVDVGRRRCRDCGTETYTPACPECDGHTESVYACPDCDIEVDPDESGRTECPRCGRTATAVETREIDLQTAYREALAAVGERENAFEILKGVKGLSSTEKTPEPIEKGILRAKHGVSTFKDGTVRYDMTDLPVTSVRPSEIDVSADRLRELGYETDIHGDPLQYDDQLVELRVQDIILSDGAAEHMMRVAAFVDDLLERYYDLEPFYELEAREDLVGELVFGMAPHTSAAVVGRVVGFTSAAVGYAHPYFHASKRRNCFHPDTKLWFEDEDGAWHYGRIDAFVEERLDPETADEDDFGTVVSELDGSVRVPSITDDGQTVLKPVDAVSKHPSQDHLIRIETQAGTSVTVTPDHPLLCWENGLKRTAAMNIDPGDRIPTHSFVQQEFHSGDNPTLAVDGGTPQLEVVEHATIVPTDVKFTYSLTVRDTHTFVANGMHIANCDGDEDCVMLLMDGLMNFSKCYLPDKRGGKMDAPLVMSSRIDPTEIDDEAHNVDIVEQYPREFYEATRRMADPGSVDITIAEDTLETDDAYSGFRHTHDTSNIAAGPDLSAYKTLGSMTEKMDAQLALARKLRAVDETDVAERIIEYHFLPDLLGNLRAFSRQETRCLDCGTKYRRVPLTGICRECGGDMTLTVHEGSVNKYLETALEIAEEFGVREYTKQRLRILERSIERIFEDDTNKQSGIADFM